MLREQLDRSQTVLALTCGNLRRLFRGMNVKRQPALRSPCRDLLQTFEPYSANAMRSDAHGHGRGTFTGKLRECSGSLEKLLRRLVKTSLPRIRRQLEAGPRIRHAQQTDSQTNRAGGID